MVTRDTQPPSDPFTPAVLPGPLLSGLEFVPRLVRLSEAGEGDFQRIAALSKQMSWRYPLHPVRMFLRVPSQVVVITDAQQRIRFVSQGFTRMTGYRPEQALDRLPKFLQGPDTSPVTRQLLRERLLQRQPFSGILLNYRADGTPYRCHFDIEPIFNESAEVVHFIAFEAEVA